MIKLRRIVGAGRVAHVGERRNAFMPLVGRPEGKRQLRKPKRRWESNIKVELQVVGSQGMNWIDLAKIRDRRGLL
jgi:hypothetical protein